MIPPEASVEQSLGTVSGMGNTGGPVGMGLGLGWGLGEGWGLGPGLGVPLGVGLGGRKLGGIGLGPAGEPAGAPNVPDPGEKPDPIGARADDVLAHCLPTHFTECAAAGAAVDPKVCDETTTRLRNPTELTTRKAMKRAFVRNGFTRPR
jgi:hypothetical protein